MHLSTQQMVRLKNRWLLVRIEFERDMVYAESPTAFPSKKELSRTIRDNLERCFGLAGTALDAQGSYLRVLHHLFRCCTYRSYTV